MKFYTHSLNSLKTKRYISISTVLHSIPTAGLKRGESFPAKGKCCGLCLAGQASSLCSVNQLPGYWDI